MRYLDVLSLSWKNISGKIITTPTPNCITPASDMSRQSDQVANWSSMAKEPLGGFSAGASGVDFALHIVVVFRRARVDAQRCVLFLRVTVSRPSRSYRFALQTR